MSPPSCIHPTVPRQYHCTRETCVTQTMATCLASQVSHYLHKINYGLEILLFYELSKTKHWVATCKADKDIDYYTDSTVLLHSQKGLCRQEGTISTLNHLLWYTHGSIVAALSLSANSLWGHFNGSWSVFSWLHWYMYTCTCVLPL